MGEAPMPRTEERSPRRDCTGCGDVLLAQNIRIIAAASNTAPPHRSGTSTRFTRSSGRHCASVEHMMTTGATGLLVRPNWAAIAFRPPRRVMCVTSDAGIVVAFVDGLIAIGRRILITSGAVPTAVPLS